MKSANGFDNPLWFVGIVENEVDKLRQGRVQVRAFGIHPPVSPDSPVQTEDLPWAPVLNYGTHGVTPPTKGDWALGIFIDGRDAQHPVVLGFIPGQTTESPNGTGFSNVYAKVSTEILKNLNQAKRTLPGAMSGLNLEVETPLAVQNALRGVISVADTVEEFLERNLDSDSFDFASELKGELGSALNSSKVGDVLNLPKMASTMTLGLESLQTGVQNLDLGAITSTLSSAANISEYFNIDALGDLANEQLGDVTSLLGSLNPSALLNIPKLSEGFKAVGGVFDQLPIESIQNTLSSVNLPDIVNIGSLSSKVQGAFSNAQSKLSEQRNLKKVRPPAISEPPVQTSTQPHKNMVWKSRNSNSYIQVGEDEEYILLSHDEGSYIQISSGGNISIKSFGDSIISSTGHNGEKHASKRLEIDGNYSLICKGLRLQVQGDMEHIVTGDYKLNVGGKFGISVGESFEVAAQRMSLGSTSEHINFTSAQQIKMDAENDISVFAGTDMFLNSVNYNNYADTVKITGTGDLDIKGATVDIDGTPLNLNGGGAAAAEINLNAAKPPSVDKPVGKGLSEDPVAPTPNPHGPSATATDDDAEPETAAEEQAGAEEQAAATETDTDAGIDTFTGEEDRKRIVEEFIADPVETLKRSNVALITDADGNKRIFINALKDEFGKPVPLSYKEGTEFMNALNAKLGTDLRYPTAEEIPKISESPDVILTKGVTYPDIANFEKYEGTGEQFNKALRLAREKIDINPLEFGKTKYYATFNEKPAFYGAYRNVATRDFYQGSSKTGGVTLLGYNPKTKTGSPGGQHEPGYKDYIHHLGATTIDPETITIFNNEGFFK